MKKLQLKKQKLSLNKEQLVVLTYKDQAEINGGFTYALSLGWQCRNSKRWGAENAYECGYVKTTAM